LHPRRRVSWRHGWLRVHQRALGPARSARRRRRGRLPRAARVAHPVPDNGGRRVHARRAASVRHADSDLRGAGALWIGSAGPNPVVHTVTLTLDRPTGATECGHRADRAGPGEPEAAAAHRGALADAAALGAWHGRAGW